MLRVSAALLLVCLAGPHVLATAEVTCSITSELKDSFGAEDGTAASLVLSSTLLGQVSELPSGTTLLVPSRQAWLEFFHGLGFSTITSAMRNATQDRHLKKLINSVVLYHVVATPDLNATGDALYVPIHTALAGYKATFEFAEGPGEGATTVEGLVTGASVVEQGEACGTPALLLDAVLLPDQLKKLAGTSSLDIPDALDALAAGKDVSRPPPQKGPSPPPPTASPPPPTASLPTPPTASPPHQTTSPPPPATSPPPPTASSPPPTASPPPPAASPPPPACPYATWADATDDFPDLTIMQGLLNLANISLSLLGGPEDGATIMLPTSSAMLNAIHSLDVTDAEAALLITRVPAIAAYLVVPKALPLDEQVPATSFQTLLGSLTGGSYPLTLRVQTNAETVPNQVRGNFNAANILNTTQVCSSWIYALDKTVLPADTVEAMPLVSLD
ncbi:hypothetical protein ACKKBF_B38345 [Auxenochlorella protothecoides x Auxenochlorella symbiontica]